MRGLYRFADIVSLKLIAAQDAEHIELFALLNSLGYHPQPEVMAKLNNSHDQDVALRFQRHGGDEGAVNLDHIHRKPAQVAEGREPGSEIIQRDAESVSPKLLQGVEYTVSRYQNALRNLKFKT